MTVSETELIPGPDMVMVEEPVAIPWTKYVGMVLVTLLSVMVEEPRLAALVERRTAEGLEVVTVTEMGDGAVPPRLAPETSV